VATYSHWPLPKKSQLSAVHTSPSSQSTGTTEHAPVSGSHTPSVHGKEAAQRGGFWQIKLNKHTSSVHASPSSQLTTC
jgi:hypothetical protein